MMNTEILSSDDSEFESECESKCESECEPECESKCESECESEREINNGTKIPSALSLETDCEITDRPSPITRTNCVLANDVSMSEEDGELTGI